jgi:hypothetical protein
MNAKKAKSLRKLVKQQGEEKGIARGDLIVVREVRYEDPQLMTNGKEKDVVRVTRQLAHRRDTQRAVYKAFKKALVK